ncbi:MAG: PepSY-like domain-containing protein [Bacteroidetes bacterium]|nr:PepSY-like domain-containing protein [Bacteroidota bacterium]
MRFVKTLILFSFIVVAFSFSVNSNVFAQEKKISEKEVPAAVLNAFHKAYPKAEIKGLSTETEKGKKYFEVESIEGTKHIDLLITKTGNITEIEETIPTDQIPGSVMKTLEAKFKGLKIEKAEKVTNGAVSNYELVIESKAGKHEVKLNAAGKLLKSEKIKKDESDESD